MRRLAVLSLHTSPLAQPGQGDSGGMNVYVRELVSALAQAGVAADVFTRRWDHTSPEVVEVEPGFRVVHVEAGPPDLAKEQLPDVVDAFADGVRAHLLALGDVDALHANYWLSGVAGHRLKHELDLPLVSTFHTLARVKAETGDPEPELRVLAEAEVIGCSDAILASCVAEADQLVRLYGADPSRIELVAPGVDHAFFSPGDRHGARGALQHLDLGVGPVLLFVGRIQPLKGLDVAVRALAALDRPDARLVVVGGASGADGAGEVERIDKLVAELGVADQLRTVEPVPHHLLSTYYRAADVVLVPSRSESFGLVALEAAACGTPVVAAAVGGLRTLVEHGRTGFLVERRDPAVFASYAEQILDAPALALELSQRAARRARDYTWSTAAGRLRRVYGDITARALVDCSERSTVSSPTAPDDLDALDARIDGWLAEQLAENPVVAAVDRDLESGERRWFVRVTGDQKDVFTVWFHLRQRTLHYETYVMPAPEENHAAFYEHLLRRNLKLYGGAFAVGDEDAIFLVGQLDNAAVDETELDRVLGSLYAWVEQCFRPALRIGFASRFSG